MDMAQRHEEVVTSPSYAQTSSSWSKMSYFKGMFYHLGALGDVVGLKPHSIAWFGDYVALLYLELLDFGCSSITCATLEGDIVG